MIILWNFWILTFFIVCFLNVIITFQINIGDCPVYYDEPCSNDMVKFTLSTNNYNNQTFLNEINPFKVDLPPNFNKNLPTKIVIHGYGGLKIDSAIRNVTAAYQKVGYNIIIVDWEALSEIPCYTTAYLNTWHVGQCVSILTLSLMSKGVSPEKLHLIGFSLGAHIAGFTGSQLKKIVGIQLNRITGLDPALPFFATLKNDWKLDSGDAKFVDVIHTSAGTIGKIEASGHVDFYVNGGSLQPFCYNKRYPPLCSHILAGIYFAESVSIKSHFIGIHCENVFNYLLGICSNENTAIMGEHATPRKTGIYFVDTNDRPPFANGLDRRFKYNKFLLSTEIS